MKLDIQIWVMIQNCTAWKVSKYGFFSGPYFPVPGLNTEIYFVNLRIQSEYGKIRTKKNSAFGHFSRSVGTCNVGTCLYMQCWYNVGTYSVGTCWYTQCWYLVHQNYSTQQDLAFSPEFSCYLWHITKNKNDLKSLQRFNFSYVLQL